MLNSFLKKLNSRLYYKRRLNQKQMSFAQKFMPSFLLKSDPLRKQLKKINLYTDDLSERTLLKSMQVFQLKQKQQKQQQTLKSLIKLLQQNTTYARKLKLISLLVQISKQTKYDVADILINKKLKIFTKNNTKIKLQAIIDKNSIEEFIYVELLVPLYNYLMKLELNQELYSTCVSGEIPYDQIFRRGVKIRFIWIFKIYNLIHVILPILENLIKFIKTFPTFKFFEEMAQIFYKDMVIMNNFIIKAIMEASNDNYILMPYFDMLQFYESLTEQIEISKKISNVYKLLSKTIPSLEKPEQLKLTSQEIQEIEVQALRVRLISNSLKNPKKDHTRLETEYNIKSDQVHKKQLALTEGNLQKQEQSGDIQDFKEKYRNLDLKYKHDMSLQQISDQDEDQQEVNN